MEKRYLGDSVYADCDGEHIILTTDNGCGPSNTIYIDETVWAALKRYVANIQNEATLWVEESG